MFYDHILRNWGLKEGQIKGFFPNIIPSTDSSDWGEEERFREEQFAKLPDFEPEISKKMKNMFRYGIPHSQRRKWWFIATGGLKVLTEAGDVWAAAERSSESTPMNDVSSFGGGIDPLEFLPPSFAERCKHFLHVVWHCNKHLEFSPLLPTVAVILLMYMEPQLAYLSIQAMINKSKADSWYFTLTRDEFLGSVEALRELVHRKNPNIEEKCKSLGLDLAQIGLALFPVFFLPFTPLPVALTLFDSFAYEGRKILVRFALCLFQNEEKPLLAAETTKDFLMVLVQGMDKLSTAKSTKAFLTKSFNIFLSRGRHINKFEDSAIKEKKGVFTKNLIRNSSSYTDMMTPDVSEVLSAPKSRRNQHEEDGEEKVHMDDLYDPALSFHVLNKFSPEELEEEQKQLQIEFTHQAAPKVIGGKLLSSQLFYNLRSFIPISMRTYCAKRVFSLSEDGTSMITVHQKCNAKKSPYIIIIKTNKRTIGAFLSNPINPEMSVRGRFYGKPSVFVFTCDPLVVYKKDKPENVLFQSATTKSFCVGGPRPAISIEDGFSVLVSEKCGTFESPSFMDSPNGDPIIDIEIYQLKVQV